jgi:hypothetical protein
VFKVAENKIKAEGILVLHSLNPLYEPYEISVQDIKEVWRFVNYISSEIPETNEMKTELLMQNLRILQRDVKQIQTKLQL